MCHSNLIQVDPHLLPPFSPVTIVQVMDVSICNSSWNNSRLVIPVYNGIPRFLLGATLLMLAVTQTLKQSISMYRATKQWQPNRYMERLAKDGILYFLVYVSSFPLLSFPSVTVTFCDPSYELTTRFTSELLGICFSIFLL